MIDSWHRARGWAGIGYHFFVRKDGQIEAGRPVKDVGSHCYGHNRDSVGVCLAGEKLFEPCQFQSLKTVLAELKKTFPEARVYGHNEFNKEKLCPVFNVEPFKQFWEQGEPSKWNNLFLLSTLLQKLFKQFLPFLERWRS